MSDSVFICIDHVGYAVPDLDAAIKLHTEVFGFRLLHKEVNEEQGVAEAMLGTGDQLPESAQVQLLGSLGPDTTIGKWLERNGGRGGVQQVCYRVSDIEKASAILRERGVTLLYDEPKTGTAGSKINFAHPKSTGGILLEIVQK
ncbi:MAG: methylmalonyl-CoA epimerase [Propionibacteriaceae bacterium]|jgi:methylmalonyl-CoA/ethylmalonyl-CoA epimerase|nr:methylmalonyl-CoA epimerase [Propionibacteriaceae bacterium]